MNEPDTTEDTRTFKLTHKQWLLLFTCLDTERAKRLSEASYQESKLDIEDRKSVEYVEWAQAKLQEVANLHTYLLVTVSGGAAKSPSQGKCSCEKLDVCEFPGRCLPGDRCGLCYLCTR